MKKNILFKILFFPILIIFMFSFCFILPACKENEPKENLVPESSINYVGIGLGNVIDEGKRAIFIYFSCEYPITKLKASGFLLNPSGQTVLTFNETTTLSPARTNPSIVIRVDTNIVYNISSASITSIKAYTKSNIEQTNNTGNSNPGDNSSNNTPDDNTPPLKTYDKKTFVDSSIKAMSQSKNSSVSYAITPPGFDLDELNLKGYYMTITVSYTVHYKKDSVLPDFMYAGAPKYELEISISNFAYRRENNLTTSKTPKEKIFSYNYDIVNIKDGKMLLTFSTDNVQNVIYFSNIKVTYNCTK